jgi:hypothetical protein
MSSLRYSNPPALQVFKDKPFPGKGLPNLSVASQSMNFLEIKLYREPVLQFRN